MANGRSAVTCQKVTKGIQNLPLSRSLPGSLIQADMLPPDIGTVAPSPQRGDGIAEMMSLPLRDARELFERRYLDAQITRFGGNISRTAAFVGMERSALHRKLRLLGFTTIERPAKLEG